MEDGNYSQIFSSIISFLASSVSALMSYSQRNKEIAAMQGQLPADNPFNFDDMASSFKGASGAQMAFNMLSAGKQFEASKSLMDYINQYNLPVNQVSRMRAAGLNPDLLGLEGTPSAQAGSPSLPNPVDFNAGSEQAERNVSMVQQIVSGALAMYQGVQQTKSVDLSNQGKEVENLFEWLNGLRGDTSDLFVSQLEDDVTINENGEVVVPVTRFSDEAMSAYGIPKRLRKSFNKVLQDVRVSPFFRERQYGQKKGAEENRFSYLRTASKNFARFGKLGEYTSYGDSVDITETLSDYGELFKETEDLQMEFQKLISEYDASYQETLNKSGSPEQQALSEKAYYRNQKELNAFQERINNLKHQFVNKTASKQPNILELLITLAATSVLDNISVNIPIGRTSHSSTIRNTYEKLD